MEQEDIKKCTEWLSNYFSKNGKLLPRRVVKAEALKSGYGQSVLKQARKILGVKLEKNFLPDKKGGKPEDYWSLG
jgi:hypothetical protein